MLTKELILNCSDELINYMDWISLRVEYGKIVITVEEEQ
jgi:hypothetical protein